MKGILSLGVHWQILILLEDIDNEIVVWAGVCLLFLILYLVRFFIFHSKWHVSQCLGC
jgi:hypothetical protein